LDRAGADAERREPGEKILRGRGRAALGCRCVVHGQGFSVALRCAQPRGWRPARRLAGLRPIVTIETERRSFLDFFPRLDDLSAFHRFAVPWRGPPDGRHPAACVLETRRWTMYRRKSRTAGRTRSRNPTGFTRRSGATA